MIKKKGFQKMKKKIWPAMICPVLFIILMRILIPFIYGMVDDRSMMEIVSGQYTGMPDPHMIFTGYWYGLLVAGFYGCSRRWTGSSVHAARKRHALD